MELSREYNEEHRSDIVCLVESRASGKKANVIFEKLGFNYSHRVEAMGFLGGIWVGWKDRSKWKLIWEGLQSSIPNNSIPWLIMEDFNAILSFVNKKNPFIVGKRFNLVGNFVDLGGTLVRLDRALANDAWMTTFSQCLVHHLTRIKSNHQPLLLFTRPDLSIPKGRPFRFLAGWIKHNDFPNFVKRKWNFTDWNRNVYGL
ncbi:reverse transcriptase [Gossypium australe]|uniref:Reverse transcriptase n=1 Tax=Gossypium australe TaxID=47621 RepID=A0A5B6VKM3_9ROSI|nr:reverse transcriptase [Gossypium australe]